MLFYFLEKCTFIYNKESPSLSVFWQIAVALPSAVGAGATEHPLEKTLLGLPLGGEHLLAQLVKDLGYLIDVVCSGDLAELALKVLGQDFALVAAHLA